MRKEGDLLQGGFPESMVAKARAALPNEARDVLKAIDGQYRRGLIGAGERDQKLVAAANDLIGQRGHELAS